MYIKLIIAFVFFYIPSFHANGQEPKVLTKIGLRGGYNACSFRVSGDNKPSTSFVYGFNYGLVAETGILPILNFQSGIYATQKGAKIKMDNGDKYNYNPTYLEIPLIARLKSDRNRLLKFYAGAGGYWGIGVGGTYSSVINGTTTSGNMVYGDRRTDNLKRNEFGVIFQTGIELRNKFDIELTYSHGTGNIIPSDIFSAQNQVLSLNLNWYLFKIKKHPNSYSSKPQSSKKESAPVKTENKSGNSDTKNVVQGANSFNSINWNGTYKGTLPCKDCKGIETVLTLNNDLTYTLSTINIGKPDSLRESKGNFSWNANGNSISFKDKKDGLIQFNVDEYTLTQLDANGKKYTGNDADKYILKKIPEQMVQANLVETYWKLVEINGKPVNKPSNNEKEIYLILKTSENKLKGYTGCNDISGTYETKPGMSIAFSQIISTRKACPDMETENLYINTLGSADNYKISGQTLFLLKGTDAPIARFEAVYFK